MRCLPALIAAFVLVLAPGCASPFGYPGSSADRGPIAHPHVVERLAPRDMDVPVGIERSASGELFLLGTVVFFIFGIAFLLAWGIGEMFRAMYEDGRARDNPYNEGPADLNPERPGTAVLQSP